jgi:hypothetical protein
MESQNDITSFTCTKCNIEKPVTDFYKNKLCKRGHQAHCKKCNSDLKKLPKDQSNPPEPKPTPTSKTCSKCKETKPLADFNNCKTSKDGKNGQCRNCHNNYFTDRVTGPRKIYLKQFDEDRKKYLKLVSPNDYKKYEDRLNNYKKYPLPLKEFECYLLYKKEDKLFDTRHKSNLPLMDEYKAWIITDEYQNFVKLNIV